MVKAEDALSVKGELLYDGDIEPIDILYAFPPAVFAGIVILVLKLAVVPPLELL